jgi:cobalt-zinc-cadmium efflux system outer membrane protein
MRTHICLLIFFLIAGNQIIGQKLLQMTIEDCESVFLKNNAELLAEQLNIEATQALIIQSKLYPNPVFSADFNLYDPQNRKVFHIDSGGQKAFQAEQLILLGGKRKTEIEIAKANKRLAEAEYADLLRNLRLEIHRNFYNIYSQGLVIEKYSRQLEILDTIISAYRIQTDKGNLPLKDLIRLKAVYIKINASKGERAAELNEAQKRLKLLLHSKEEVLPVVLETDFNRFQAQKTIAELQQMAVQNRPDLQVAEMNTSVAQLFVEREKKKKIPDMVVNGSYDQRGGAFRNQVNIGVALPIPILNNNRGNIKAAEFDRDAIRLYASEKRLEVELDVQEAWLNITRTITEYKKVKELYDEEFGAVYNGINDNFNRRNVTILEFVDFVESYNESLSEFEKIKRKLAEAAALINYLTASKIY